MNTKNLLTSILLTAIFLISAIYLVAAASSVAGDSLGNKVVNVTLAFPSGNSTVYANSNQTVVLNFTVTNRSTLQGSNWTYILDGTGYILCNSSGTTPALQPGVNASGCLTDGNTNYLYLNVTEGRHVIEINITFGTTNQSSSINQTWKNGNETFVVTNFQSLTFASGIPAMWQNKSWTAIPMNVTFNSQIWKNITFSLFNFTGTGVKIYNLTFGNGSALVNDTGTGVANFTLNALPNNWYTFNVTLQDNETYSNYTIYRELVLDTTAPTASISCTGWKSSDDSTVTKDATLTCTCSGTDSNSTSLVYTYDPSSTPTTATAGSWFGVRCRATDQAGNNVTSSTLSYYVTEEVVSDGGGSSGGSSSSSAAAAITGNTFIVTTEQFSSGHTAQLSANDGFKVTFKSSKVEIPQQHTIKISEVSATSATIIISSDPITLKLNIGEEKKVDVDGDGVYDVYAKLNTITDGKADVTIKQISEDVPAGEEGPVSGGTGLESEDKKSTAWIWIIVILVILVAVGVGLAKKKKK